MIFKSRPRSIPLWVLLGAFLSLALGSEAATVTNNVLSRKIVVTTKQTRGFHGMTAKSKVIITTDVRTDSYDSLDPASSTGGFYDAAKAGEDGFIGTTSKVADDLEISGQAKIKGQIATGAPGVLKPLSGTAAVGSGAFVNAGNIGVQSGWHRDDLNVAFPDVVLPSGLTLAPPPVAGIVGGTNYTYVLGNGIRKVMGTFKLDSSQTAMVTGKAILYVTDTFDISGSARMIIAPGGSLELYVEKATSISGGGLINQTGNAANLAYYGMKNNLQVYISGTAGFIGTIYAPYAKLDLTGASALYGATVSNEIVLGGTFFFHFDQALSSRGLRYIPRSWKES